MSTDTIASKYKIIREIARSNDVVYEAVDLEMGRRIALKELVVPPNLTGTARRERIERFHREARASGKLSHPNIVTVYSYGEDNGRYYIAMEYLEGGTLRDVMQTRGALPVQEAVEIASQVLSALSHAHANRVIHRDVKPDNIHILPGGQVKLTDFGIARLTEEASLTGEGQVFGTPSYMSPEQIKGQNIDFRSDIFSAGIVLYEMVAGRKPFTGDSVISITYAIMQSEPPS
jgi:eukaryotic-like serine/threonine-protein kinase